MSYERFEKLEEDKKAVIINAGFQIFGKFGYSKASVDEIVKEANISKGSLFYYFESKKNFYLYLYEYCAILIERLVDSPGPDGLPAYLQYTDFFDRLSAIEMLKMKFTEEYPGINAFIKKIISDPSPVIQSEITKFNERYTKERALYFFQGLDYSKFKDGIEPRMIINLLTWCSEGCLNQLLLESRLESANSSSLQNSPDMKKLTDMYHQYVALFRNNFYKEEFLK